MSFHLCKLSKKVEHRDFCNLDFFRRRQVVGTSSLRRYPSTEKELRPSSRWPGSFWRQAVWIYSSVLVCLTKALVFALVLFSKYKPSGYIVKYYYHQRPLTDRSHVNLKRLRRRSRWWRRRRTGLKLLPGWVWLSLSILSIWSTEKKHAAMHIGSKYLP